MDDYITPQMITDIIVNTLSDATLATGSQIGFAIKNAFPDFNFKEQYTNLGSFIKTYCQDTVAIADKRGYDNIYTLYETGIKLNTAYIEDRSMNPWIVFSDPRIEKSLYIDINTHEFCFVDADYEAAGRNLVNIRRMNNDDYKSIATNFINDEISNDNKESLMQLFNSEKFWIIFANTVKKEFGYDKYLKLLELRRTQISNLFVDRLTHAGIDKEKAEFIVALSTKKYSHHKSNAFNSTGSKTTEHSVSYTRRLLHAAIDLMSEADLRSINLPIGIIIDAIKH